MENGVSVDEWATSIERSFGPRIDLRETRCAFDFFLNSREGATDPLRTASRFTAGNITPAGFSAALARGGQIEIAD